MLRVWGKDPGFVPGSRMTRLGLCFRKLSDCTPREGPERDERVSHAQERPGRRLSQRSRKDVMRAWIDKSGKNGQEGQEKDIIQGKVHSSSFPKLFCP